MSVLSTFIELLDIELTEIILLKYAWMLTFCKGHS